MLSSNLMGTHDNKDHFGDISSASRSCHYPLVPDAPPPEHSAEEEGLGTCSSGTDEFGLSVAQPTWASFSEMESEGWGGVGWGPSFLLLYIIGKDNVPSLVF